MKKYFYILVLFFLINSFKLSAQNTAAEKARIVFNLAKEITWENENDIVNYTIGILEQKDSVYNTFVGFKESHQLLKAKPVEIIQFKKIGALKEYLDYNDIQIFYLSGKYLKEQDTVASLFNNHATLLIFDNAKSKEKCVVNLLDNPDKYYEINYKNALAHHLKLTENILVLGGDEHLLREMYLDSMKVLRQERDNILLKLYRIEDQEARLELRHQELLNREQELDSVNNLLREQKHLIKEQKRILRKNLIYIQKQKKEIKDLKLTYQEQLNRIDSVELELKNRQEELNIKQKKLHSLDKELVKSLKRIKSQSDYIKLGILLFVVLISIVLILYIKSKEAKKIKEQNKIIKNKNEEILQINEELETHQMIISEQNMLLTKQIREITGSINYARKIQLALFPIKEILDANFKDNFILYRPKDIVSGDFYWFRQIGEKIIVVVADCTGHGVPGAFMSVLGMTFLSEVTSMYNEKASIILEKVREKLIKSLDQETDDFQVRDGIDMALAIIDKKNKMINFSGAYNSMVKISRENGEVNLVEIKGDNMPVGYHFHWEKLRNFTEYQIKYKPGDRIYMFSDGYKDQFGGKKGRKLSKKRFYDLLKSLQHKKIIEQKAELNKFLDKWMEGSKIGQVDDVLVLGLELK